MADNVEITAGTGTSIATDDAGAGGHVQIVKLALSADGSASPITADSNGLEVQGAGTAGSPAGGVVSVQGVGSGTALPVSLSTLPALVAGAANIGDVDVLTVPEHAGVAADVMSATSGDTFTALTSTAQAIKGSAGKLLGWYVYNPNTVACWVVFYNVASGSVTVGTTTPRFLIAIPAGSAANLWCQPGGISFSTAMSWAAVMTTAGGNTAPTTALEANAFWI